MMKLIEERQMRRATLSVMAVAIVALGMIHSRAALGQTTAPATSAKSVGSPNAPLGAANYIPSIERPTGWRGDGTGRFPAATPPLKWARSAAGGRPESEGILWMTPVPAGGSSPIVVGDRIFFGFDPYGLICVSKTDGHILWYHTHHYYEVMPDADRKTIEDKAGPIYAKIKQQMDAELGRMSSAVSPAGVPDKARFMNEQWRRQLEGDQKQLDSAVQDVDKAKYTANKNSWEFAAATPISDGKYVYMWFSNRVAVCYDLDGKRQWVTMEPAGEKTCGEHGRHSSPALMGDKFIVQYANNVIAFDRKTGKPAWTKVMEAPHWATPTYSSLTPTVVGGVQYVVSARGEGFRVADGELGWGPFKDYGGEDASAIVESGHIFLWDRSGMIQLLIPNVPGPNVKVTVGKSRRGKQNEFYMVASPLYVDGLVYFVSDKALLYVFDPETGTTLYEKQLPLNAHVEYVWYPGISSSPTLAGKYIYIIDNQGGTLILQPGKEYKEIAVNKIVTAEKQGANEQTVANPVFDGKLMLLRGQQYLYCIGSK
jgi:outer membrane protein assembly factor BamB